MALKVGQKAPSFQLKNSENVLVSLPENLPCIVYFYPKDFTPGCTEEACSFRDQHHIFKGLNIHVFGISKDSPATHKRFRAKHDLPFELLSDHSGNVCKAYGALMPIVNIPKRITYLIDSKQQVAAIYSDLFGARKHIEHMIAQLKTE